MSSDSIRAFGQVLREVRKAKGFSQEALAYESDLDRAFISLLESGRKQPSLSTIFALAAALGTTASALLHLVESKIQAVKQA